MEERAKDGAAEDNGANNSTKSGDKGESSQSSENEAANEEKEKITEHENQLGNGYKPNSDKTASPRRWGFSRRQTIGGGGVVGTIIALIFGFSIFQGPLEFVHIAQLMQQFHFSSQQDMADERFTKIARYLRYKSSGQVEKTRLGYFQNKIADRIETRMNEVGIKSSYTSTFGYGDGYIVDPEKLSANTEFKDLNGKSRAEIEKYFKDNFNVDIKTKLPNGRVVPNGTFFVDANAAKLGYFQNRKIVAAMTKAAGFNAKTSVVGSRVMSKRTGSTLHPIESLKRSKLSDVERKLTFRKEQVKYVENGVSSRIEAVNNADPKDKVATDTANGQAAAAQQAIADGSQAFSDLSGGDSTALDKLSSSLSNKFSLGALTATGVLCIFSGLDKNADQIHESQVVLPLVRQGVQSISLGNQVMSGQDLDTTSLGDYKDLLNGKVNGKKTSWFQAESIQAELGRSTDGTIKPGKTLTTINSNSPFHFLNTGGLGSAIGAVCSPVGTIAQLAIGFAGGGIESQLAQLAVGEIVGRALMDDAARWLAGAAVNPLATGADYGNAINFGSRLASNAQAVSEGGRKLSSSESKVLTALENNQSQKEFQSHSIAYQLFDPYDYRSATAKLIDQQSLQPSNLASGLLNFGHIFAGLPSLFAPKVQAAGTGYNYGFPKYGFSLDEMNSSKVQNPYQNADDVVNRILPAHHEYVERAENCFGVTINDSDYDITSFGPDPIDAADPDPSVQNFYTEDEKRNEANKYCADPTSDWVQVRFYIFDSQAITSVACYTGDSNDIDTKQACSDIGFDEAQAQDSSNNSNNTNPASGDAQDLAKIILNNKNIGLTCYSASVKQDVQAAADGKAGTAGVKTSSAVLKLIATVGQSHKVCITAIQSNGGGHSPDSLHYAGDAVDFGNLDGIAITGRNGPALTIIRIAFDILDQGSIGQSQCGSTPTLPSGWTTFTDACNHLHVQVPRGTQ
jgi:hypothetical protein